MGGWGGLVIDMESDTGRKVVSGCTCSQIFFTSSHTFIEDQHYTIHEIFNYGDDTGLYYKLLPHKTLAVREYSWIYQCMELIIIEQW
jgi:hypothetical protein